MYQGYLGGGGLGSAYKKTFGDTKSPINEVFKQFRIKWTTINIESGFKTLKINNREVKSKREQVIVLSYGEFSLVDIVDFMIKAYNFEVDLDYI